MSAALPLARLTAGEILRQPLTHAACAVTLGVLFLASFLPSFTPEPQGDVKFMTDVGLAAVSLCLLAVGIWPATTLLVDELTQKTALTLLSKPVSRGEYLGGRALGVAAALAAAATVLAPALVGAVWLTESQVLGAPLDALFADAGISSHSHDPDETHAHEDELARTPLPLARWHLAGTCLLGLGQATMLCALAVAFSIRLGTLPNLACCAGTFFLGHLVEPLSGTVPVGWASAALRLALPNFGFFDPSEAVACGIPIPLGYAAGSAAYAALYAGAVLLVAARLFERREIA